MDAAVRPTTAEPQDDTARLKEEAEKAARMEKAAKLRAQRDGVRRRRKEYMRRRGLTSIPGSILVDRTNCNNINIDGLLGLNRPVEKKDVLEIEELFWKAAMDYLGSKDIYDLISYSITMYPVVFESHVWYHCNLLGRRRDDAHASPTVFFVEMKCGTGYNNVMACIPLDGNTYNKCKICSSSCDILHPAEGFTCGSKGGQQIFH